MSIIWPLFSFLSLSPYGPYIQSRCFCFLLLYLVKALLSRIERIGGLSFFMAWTRRFLIWRVYGVCLSIPWPPLRRTPQKPAISNEIGGRLPLSLTPSPSPQLSIHRSINNFNLMQSPIPIAILQPRRSRRTRRLMPQFNPITRPRIRIRLRIPHRFLLERSRSVGVR